MDSTMLNNTTSAYAELQAFGDDMRGMVSAAGKRMGLPDGQMQGIGMVESGLAKAAKAATSSATGLYQFTGPTWKQQMKRYGAEFGIPEGTPATDAVANALLGAAYMRDNNQAFRDQFGRDPDIVDTYMGHFLGETGRKKFMKAKESDPNAPAAMFVGKRAASANRAIFFNEDGSMKSLQDVYSAFGNKLGAAQDTGTNDAVINQIKQRSFLTSEMSDAVAAFAPSGQTPEFSRRDESLGQSRGFAETVADLGRIKPEAEPTEERGFFDGTWEAVKGNLRLSVGGQWASDIGLGGYGDIRDNKLDNAAMSVLKAFAPDDLDDQMFMQGIGPKKFEISQEMLDKAVEGGLDRKWLPFINQSVTPRGFIQKVQQAQEMQKAEAGRQGAEIGGQLVGGLAGAVGDPTSFMGGGGAGMGLLSKMFVSGAVGAAGAAAVEESLEAQTRGAIEANTAAAAIGGFGAGVIFRGLGEAFANWGAATRMRSRQEHLDAGLDDSTSRFDVELNEGKRYGDLPNEPGAVVDEFGNTHSATSMGNPKTQEEAVEEHIRANKGVELGSVGMIAQSLLRSESNEVRGLAANLVRSPTGIEGGGSGVQRMTAEDILSRIEGQDNLLFSRALKARQKAYDRSVFGGNGQSRDLMERSVVEAIESGDYGKLTPEQDEYARWLVTNYTEKFDLAMNIARFGNADAPTVFSTRRDPTKYIPQVYEEGKVLAAKARFGGEEGLQDAIRKNWMSQWKADHAGVQAKFKEYFAADIKDALKSAGPDADEAKIIDKMVADYIDSKSYGISKNGDFVHTALEDANISDELAGGLRNNDFTKERNLFDSAYRSAAEDGGEFAMNDLRHFDMLNIMQMYNRRINGDIAINGSTGKNAASLAMAISKLPKGKDRTTMEQLHRIITGRSRVDNGPQASETLLRGLQEISFGSMSAQMWVNNLTEASGWATNRLMHMMREGVPAMKQLFNPETKYTKADIKDFSDAIFGKEMNDALVPAFSNVKESLMQNGSGATFANIAAGVRVAGAVVSNQRFNPYVRLLSGTQEVLTGMARSGVISDLTNEAFGGVKINRNILKAASVTDEQYAGILAMLKQHVRVEDGKYVPDIRAIKHDPRTNDLWRLADYIASDSVFRTNKVGMNYVARPSAMMNLALQFKAFMLKGLNGRVVRGYNDYFKGGRSVDGAMRMLLGTGLTGAIWSMQVLYRSVGIPEAERDAYLKKMLDPAMIGYQAMSRSAELGPALGAVNLALGAATGKDIFRLGRSTVDPRTAQKDALKAGEVGQKQVAERVKTIIYDNVPTFRIVGSAAAIPENVADWATAKHGYQSDMQLRAFYENLGTMAPNAPEVQWLINQMAEQSGAAGKRVK